VTASPTSDTSRFETPHRAGSQLQRAPSEIKTLLHYDDLLTELLAPLVQAKLGEFDPVQYR
jgi:hypothetical protein